MSKKIVIPCSHIQYVNILLNFLKNLVISANWVKYWNYFGHFSLIFRLNRILILIFDRDINNVKGAGISKPRERTTLPFNRDHFAKKNNRSFSERLIRYTSFIFEKENNYSYSDKMPNSCAAYNCTNRRVKWS